MWTSPGWWLSEENRALRQGPSVVGVVGSQQGNPVQNDTQNHAHVENLVGRADDVKGTGGPLFGHSGGVDAGSANIGGRLEQDPRQLDPQNGSFVSESETGVDDGEASGETKEHKHEGSERPPFAGVELFHERHASTDCAQRKGQAPVQPSFVVSVVVTVEDDAEHGGDDKRHDSQIVELVAGSGHLLRVALDAVEGGTHAQTRDDSKHEENEDAVVLPGGCGVDGQTHVEVGAQSVGRHASHKGGEGRDQVRVDVDRLIVDKAQGFEGLFVAVGFLDVAPSYVAVVSLPRGNVVPQVSQRLLDLLYGVCHRVLGMFYERFLSAGVCSEADLAGGGGGACRRHGSWWSFGGGLLDDHVSF